ncbi:gamma-glutamyl-gamma-aminobutyrate hydrolase family protein, partial [Mesorhizobium sp. M0814]|uniref:gamma-glutamyl-gamma-aminobutyrate hydrolase family protein n=1 Tax=Mesorhizobium sp. M0814 TaxID=2957004 RepID=UPI0033392D7E
VSNFDAEKEGYFCPVPYVRAIEKAGALPIILPYVKADEVSTVLDRISGVVLAGGGDCWRSFHSAENVERSSGSHN